MNVITMPCKTGDLIKPRGLSSIWVVEGFESPKIIVRNPKTDITYKYSLEEFITNAEIIEDTNVVDIENLESEIHRE